MKIVQVSPSLKKILGYPVDSWIGRELTSFLHRKDVVTVNSSFVLDDPDKFDTYFSFQFDEDGNAISDALTKVLYCRLRHFKSLNSGFNLEKKDQYTSFQASVSMKKFNSDKFKSKQFLLLECQPLNSAYNKNWSEMSTEKKTFGTRHSLFCSYTYIHPNAIPLLGYLPQDMVGMSIFDFYHPEEFEQLYNIYRQVISSKGTTISGPKIRFRTHNGDWIYVKTEWSSFINPWSKRLEFIIGQHTVIKGPQNIDVFSPPTPRQDCIAEEPERYHKNLRLIRKLLLQPVVDEARSMVLNIVEEPTEEVSVSPALDCGKKETSIKTQEAKKKFQSASRDEQSNAILDDKLTGTYEQLSYANNIKTFLTSQLKTYSSSSSSSDKRSGNDSKTDGSNFIDSDDVTDFGVDIPYPKPPSFCSSTKVLVSEKEDMILSPSCQTDEMVEETSREAQIIDSAIQEPNVLVSLTQETLREHTKQQEKMYLEQAKQDSIQVLLNMTSKYSVQQESSKGLKRGHFTDLDETRKFKSFKTEDVSMLSPPFPMTTAGLVMKPASGQPKIAFNNMYGIGLTQGTGAMYHGGHMPVVQLSQQPPITDGKPGNIQWPYYPQSGLSFYPQVMGGFYQPMTVLSCPLPLWTSGNTRGGVATTKHKASDMGSTPMPISNSSSGESTSSTLMYLLELSNNQEISKAKGSKASATVPRKRHSDPPWLFGVLWVERIQMRYIVSKRKFNRIMKEDRDALKLLNQSDVVLKQMEELKKNIEKSQEPTEDEEADYLFMIDPDLFKDDSSSDSREIEASEKLRCSFTSFSASNTTHEIITKSGNGDDNSLSETCDSLVGDEMDDQEKKSESECHLLANSGYNDSSVDMESTSSTASDLTLSDSRSTDNKGSSMKESDTQSSKFSERIKDSESENVLNQTQHLTSQFYNFFVKNPTKFKHSKNGFWIKEANMNERIKMEYTLKNNSRKDVLSDDLNRLNEMNQSAVVQKQFSYLLEDVKTEEQKILCSFCEILGEMSSNTKCSTCAKEQNMKTMHENFFDSLFMKPLFPQGIQEAYSSEDPIRDSPDMEDVYDIIDAVD